MKLRHVGIGEAQDSDADVKSAIVGLGPCRTVSRAVALRFRRIRVVGRRCGYGRNSTAPHIIERV